MAAASQKGEKPCRVCGDFKTWQRQQKSKKPDDAKDCPADREQLGRATWTFLHTMAAYYPEQPSVAEQEEMKAFMTNFSKFYPCQDCAEHLRGRMKVNPIKVANQNELSHWMCEIHNDINELLGKKLFDCSKVNERWRDGWKDGSCDL